MTSIKNLFGGAISVLLPSQLIDTSDFRQVPDSQEVFLYPESETSVIIEILQAVEPSDLTDAAKFHFGALAQDNSAALSEVKEVQTLTREIDNKMSPPTVLIGIQKISKFNQNELDDVLIMMALFRVPEKQVDLVLTFNVPAVSHDGNAVGEAERAGMDFNTAAESLQILDFGLFA